MLTALKERNPGLPVFSVYDPAFAEYGEIVRGVDCSALICEALKIEMPDEGSAYRPSIPALEAVPEYAIFRDECFGGMALQIGLCWGYNTALDALEYHKCTEINVAATDMVLFLARLADLEDGTLASDRVKAFFVPRGTAVELYNCTLHYCPCQTGEGGFSSVVLLMRGTNGERSFPTADRRLIGQNKWVLWHGDAAPEGGCVAITGENLHLAY